MPTSVDSNQPISTGNCCNLPLSPCSSLPTRGSLCCCLLEGTELGLIFKPKGNHTPKAHLWALFFLIQFCVSSRYTQDICKRSYLLLPSFAECSLRARSMRGSMARHLRKRGKGRSMPRAWYSPTQEQHRAVCCGVGQGHSHPSSLRQESGPGDAGCPNASLVCLKTSP